MARTRRKQKSVPIPIILLAIALSLFMYYQSTQEEPFTPVDGSMYVHFIDVGQGDSILITTGNDAALIDTGESEHAQTVIDYLHSVGVTKLAYAVATHPHSDHMGGMAKIINAFPIETFIAPDAVNTSAAFERMLTALENNSLEITVPSLGDTFKLGDATLTALVPQYIAANDLNNQSVVLRLDFGQTRFLFTGDAEAAAETEMLASGISLNCDVLKVGHHGSRTSSSIDFLQAVSPAITIISCGANNSYGHPHDEVVKRLNDINATIRQTDKEGTIVLVSDGSRIVNGN